jgi:hypothetical protein
MNNEQFYFFYNKLKINYLKDWHEFAFNHGNYYSLKLKEMKVFSLLITIVILGVTMAQAQCDKNVKITTSNTKRMDANGNVTSDVKETLIFHIGQKAINVEVNGGIVATAEVISMECEWSVPFKTGKTVIKGVLINEQGDKMDMTNVIEGKDGVITVTGTIVGGQDKIIINQVARFEEEVI